MDQFHRIKKSKPKVIMVEVDSISAGDSGGAADLIARFLYFAFVMTVIARSLRAL